MMIALTRGTVSALAEDMLNKPSKVGALCRARQSCGVGQEKSQIRANELLKPRKSPRGQMVGRGRAQVLRCISKFAQTNFGADGDQENSTNKLMQTAKSMDYQMVGGGLPVPVQGHPQDLYEQTIENGNFTA
jgi:hypothetical protein